MSRPDTLLVLCLSMTTGCARLDLDERLSSLEQEEQLRRARLDELEVQISSAERRIAQARADAQFQECRASKTRLEAEVAIARADCTRAVAERGACVAKNESRTTKGAGLGCAAGWAAALLTGGAAAPAVALGCAGGAALSHATRNECGEVPACAKQGDPTADVLRRHGHSAMPVCSRAVVEAKTETPGASTAMHARPSIPKHPPEPRRACETWTIEWIELASPHHKHSGEAWDADGSAPELIYTIHVDGQRSYRSPKYETYDWKHAPQATILVSPGQDLAIDLIDWDIGSNERIASFRGKLPQELPSNALPLTSGRATARVRLTCSSD